MNKGEAIPTMQKNILATFYHLTSTDTNHNHLYCPEGPDSWCFFNKASARNVPVISHQKMRIKLLVTEEHELSANELLIKCLKCRTQNLNESFNGKIRCKCPKQRLHGKAWEFVRTRWRQLSTT